jgi:hypothetical protein
MRVSDLPRAWRVGFDEVAEQYDKVRPGFPDELFDELAAALPPAQWSSKLVRARAKRRRVSLPEAPG